MQHARGTWQQPSLASPAAQLWSRPPTWHNHHAKQLAASFVRRPISSFCVLVGERFPAIFAFRVAAVAEPYLPMPLLPIPVQGEAQKIDRLMETFAKRFCEQNEVRNLAGPARRCMLGTPGKDICHPRTTLGKQLLSIDIRCTVVLLLITLQGLFKTTDGCFILSFATIMLNTSLYNPAAGRKPTCQEFQNMNRGVDDGSDLPQSLLIEVYNSIEKTQFKVGRRSFLTDTIYLRITWCMCTRVSSRRKLNPLFII